MSTEATRTFLPTLREIESRLRVPIPARMQIIRELEFDLEQLQANFVAEGMTAEEAYARAMEALVPDPRALEPSRGWDYLRSLVREHQTLAHELARIGTRLRNELVHPAAIPARDVEVAL